MGILQDRLSLERLVKHKDKLTLPFIIEVDFWLIEQNQGFAFIQEGYEAQACQIEAIRGGALDL